MGWGSEWPFGWGGGDSEIETLWFTLRKMLGEKGPGPLHGLEDSWRRAKAEGMIPALVAAERAVLQAFPNLATDHLPVYEEILAVPPQDTDQESREAVAAAWTANLSAVLTELGARLAEIDPGISVGLVPWDNAASARFGRSYAPRSGGPYYGDRVATAWPNYSGRWLVLVEWSGAPNNVPPPAKLAQVQDILGDTLPAWNDWTIYTSSGFFCDGFNGSKLDLSVLAS